MLPEVEKNDTDEIYPRHLWSKEAKERDNDDERMDAGEIFVKFLLTPRCRSTQIWAIALEQLTLKKNFRLPFAFAKLFKC